MEKENDLRLVAYDVKSKTRNTPMNDVVLTKTAKGAYIAKGISDTGNKLTTLLNEKKAFDAIRNGVAKCGWDDNFVLPPAEEEKPADNAEEGGANE